jgi:hypothetical protein
VSGQEVPAFSTSLSMVSSTFCTFTSPVGSAVIPLVLTMPLCTTTKLMSGIG